MDTATQQTPALGEAFEGGYFGGILLINGIRYGIVWAPKAHDFRSAILDVSSKVIEAAGSFSDSVANTQALLAAGSPAVQKVAALDINGFTDWAIPARDALELGYRHFKPTKQKNYCGFRDGENPSSVPFGGLYTPDSPARTKAKEFAGSEAFEDAWYWSSTIDSRGYAFCQLFDDGGQYDSLLHDYSLVRAVRQIRLDS